MWRSVLPRMGEKSQRDPPLLAISGIGTRLGGIGNQGVKEVQEGGGDGPGNLGWLVGERHVDLLQVVRARVPVGWVLRHALLGPRPDDSSMLTHPL